MNVTSLFAFKQGDKIDVISTSSSHLFLLRNRTRMDLCNLAPHHELRTQKLTSEVLQVQNQALKC